MNQAFNYIIALFVGVVIGLLLFNSCEQKETVKIDNTPYFNKLKADSLLIYKLTIKQKEDSIKVIVSKDKEDSLKIIADKNEKLYKSSSKKVRELLAIGICDTISVETAMNDCDSTIKNKNDLLAQKDSTFNKVQEELNTAKQELTISKSMVETAKTIINNQIDNYKTLENTTKKQVKKAKRKAVITALVSGVIVGAVLWFKR